MADLGTARSVSGEMMAAAHMSRRGAAEADVIDADYVEVSPEPRRTRRLQEPVPGSSKQAGLAMLDKRQKSPRRRVPVRGGPLFWLAGIIAAGAAFWISGGHSMLPAGLLSGAKAEAPDLQIANVRSRTEIVEGEPALLVDGDIHNAGEAPGRVPTLAVQILSREGETIVYRLGTLRTPLAPGAKYSFSGRLDMPKDGVETVSVTFDQ